MVRQLLPDLLSSFVESLGRSLKIELRRNIKRQGTDFNFNKRIYFSEI